MEPPDARIINGRNADGGEVSIHLPRTADNVDDEFKFSGAGDWLHSFNASPVETGALTASVIVQADVLMDHLPAGLSKKNPVEVRGEQSGVKGTTYMDGTKYQCEPEDWNIVFKLANARWWEVWSARTATGYQRVRAVMVMRNLVAQ